MTMTEEAQATNEGALVERWRQIARDRHSGADVRSFERVAETTPAIVELPRRRRSLADYLFWIVGGLVVVGLAVAVAFLVTGGRTLIVRSGSMASTIEAGDVVVTKSVRPTDVSVGDIVSFSDPSRNGDIVTHRIVQMKRDGDTFLFQTKGDANTGVENWSMYARGTLGLYQFHVPKVGFVLAWASSPVLRTGLVVFGALVLLIAALRRIWAS